MGKLTRVPKDLRPLRQSARQGNHSAAKSLLRIYGFDGLAAEIKSNLPFSPPVRRLIAALTAGTGEGDQLDEWERINKWGQVESLLIPDPPSPRRAYARPTVFEDDEDEDAASRRRG
jgi:hypothetical protein